jgi:diadenosine tetraphosphate (Ap4A) HIT family hydrolase
MTTAIHRRVAALREGVDLTKVARLRSGWLVLGSPQVVPGYCLLLPDPVVPDLNAFTGAERMQFLQDMAECGDVLRDQMGAVRINYAMFGNVEPALHAHLFPRRSDEPAAQVTAQPWALDWEAAASFDSSLHRELRERLSAAIRARVSGAC